ncbi:acetyl-CoA synthetase-like protein, partial [Anaeromyces robustus]
MTNSLGNYLRGKDVSRNDIIPIISDRSPYYVIGTLAISKAGGAFLPIDPKLPIDRIEFILNEVKPKLVLYNNTESIINNLNQENYKYYDIQNHDYDLHNTKIDNINDPNDTCYVIFTSGTTGKPKGTLVSHFNIYNIMNLWIRNKNVHNILGISNFSFDASHVEIILSLIHGLKLVLVDDNISNDINLLSKYIIENNVQLIQTTPSRVKLFMEYENFRKVLTNIKILVFGGEELSIEFCKEIRKYSDCEIYNGYGPTECTIACSFKKVDVTRKNKNTIGSPLCNCKVYILDKYLKPVPIGVEGEICIGGYGVGKGYLNREELTNEKFIVNPFDKTNDEHNKLIYRTGDLGKWTSDGEIDYLGRIDFQVKIHGQRIELGEIEKTIMELDNIEKCVVIDKKKESGEKYLMCYYISHDEVQNREIREYLNQKLPRYMVPNYYKRIFEMPLTTNGKLDRKTLPEPDLSDYVREQYEAPITETERSICKIFSGIFNIPENDIGRNSDFYELGGDSMVAIRVLSIIEKELKLNIYIKDIMKYSNVCQLSKYIDELLSSNETFNKIDIIERHNKKEFPVTSQQLGVYIDSIKNPESTTYNIPVTFKLNKNVNIEKVKEGFISLFEKQEVFRTKYMEKEVNGKIEVYGFVDDECLLIFETYNYENINTFIRPFKLSEAPLIRVGFVDDEVLLIDIHHIIGDGSTLTIIKNELNKYYNDMELDELEIQFSDYAIDLNEKKVNGSYEHQIEFYKKIFNKDYEVLNLPKKNKIINEEETDLSRVKSFEKVIDEATSKSINQFAKTNGISKTALFISIYGYVLSKYSGQDVIYTSIISANRNNHYVENMVGMFVSTLPILLNFDNEVSFFDFIKNNMNVIVEVYNNQSISFSELVELLKLKKINNSFVFQPNINNNNNNKKNSINNIFDDNIKSENDYSLYESKDNLIQNNNQSKFDIAINVIERDSDYLITIDYNTKIYNDEIIENILNSFVEVSRNVNKFNQKICELEYIPKEEKEKVLYKFNSSIDTSNCNKLYHEEFCKIVSNNPDRCAIVFNDLKLSFKELDDMTNSLGNYLRGKDVSRNDIIPIISDRSPYYVIGTLAISKAGGAFLPIDPKLPIDRIEFILNEVKPKLVLYSNTESIINNLNQENYKYYDIQNHDYDLQNTKIDNINDPNDTCYVIFTSGTTGKPKGTLVSHFNTYNIMRASNGNKTNHSFYDLWIRNKNVHNILGITNFSFDPSYVEIILSLIHGLKLVLVDDNISNDINLLSNCIIENNVQLIQTTPSRVKLFMENENFRKVLTNIKILVFGGEELSIEFCKEIRKYSDCEIYNVYGPTECTIACSFKKVDVTRKNKNTIGSPLCNCKVYILDKYLKPVPIGVEGEICIGGYGVGKGYLNREELTNEKFIVNPFDKTNDEHNKLIYRTGDLGKWTSDGEIDYLGRIDFQVKIHGQRIELGEIEKTIMELDNIEKCVVIDKKKESGEKYLMCYYISHDEVQNREIREYLNQKLPRYMVPNYYKRIFEMPLTTNGKLDRKTLPEPDLSDYVREQYEAPITETERSICKIFSGIFNIPENDIGRNSDFYELGGDSMVAIRVLSIIEKELKLNIYIKDIMKYSNVCQLSKYIDELLSSNETFNKIDIIERHNKKEFPVTSQQLGVYIDSIKNPESTTYNIPVTFKLNKNVNIEKVKEGFISLFEKQEVFRTKYMEKEVNGKIEVYGFVDDECLLIFETYNYENINTFIRPFKLSEAPLIRVGFVDDEVLLIDIHHIIGDGSTLTIIKNELNKYYNDMELDELEIQFSDYAIDLNEKKVNGSYEHQIEFYKKIFNKDYEVLNLPKKNKIINEEETDLSRVKSFEKVIDEATSKSINQFAKTNGISKTALFISIYGYVLSKYSGQDVIYTSIISANRNNHYVENMVGMFVSTLPILLNFDNEVSFFDFIKNNMNVIVEVYNNQSISFSELVELLKLKKINNSFVFQPNINNNNNNKKNSINNIFDDNIKSEND